MVYVMKHLFMISFVVYLGLNLVENLIHYNIGKYSNESTHIDMPSSTDWVKIILVMVTFAGLQGLLTCRLDREC
jgi:hypothetical protein